MGRNAELVLQSRITDFTPAMLESLLYEDRKLVDGWDKMMAIYPVEDWPYFHRYRAAMLNYYGREDQPATAVFPQVREELHQRGPLSSIDVTLDAKVNWHWGPTRMARAALESMYAWGELIVHHKVNTRKVYDFAANHIDRELLAAADPFSSEEEYQDWHISRRLGSIGIMWNRGSNAWLAIRGVKSRERTQAIQRLLESGEVVELWRNPECTINWVRLTSGRSVGSLKSQTEEIKAKTSSLSTISFWGSAWKVQKSKICPLTWPSPCSKTRKTESTLDCPCQAIWTIQSSATGI